jgi:hypothetical protein
MLTARPVILADAEALRKSEAPGSLAGDEYLDSEEEQLYLIELRYQECMARRALLDLLEEPGA